MGEKGQVIKKNGAHVTVRLTRQEACSKCKACIAGLTNSEMLIEANNLCDASIDDWVNIELQSQKFLEAVSIMYGIPFLFLFAGFVGGYYGAAALGLARTDVAGFAAGVILMLLAFYGIRKRENNFRQGGYTPTATEIVKNW